MRCSQIQPPFGRIFYRDGMIHRKSRTSNGGAATYVHPTDAPHDGSTAPGKRGPSSRSRGLRPRRRKSNGLPPAVSSRISLILRRTRPGISPASVAPGTRTGAGSTSVCSGIEHEKRRRRPIQHGRGARDRALHHGDAGGQGVGGYRLGSEPFLLTLLHATGAYSGMVVLLCAIGCSFLRAAPRLRSKSPE